MVKPKKPFIVLNKNFMILFDQKQKNSLWFLIYKLNKV